MDWLQNCQEKAASARLPLRTVRKMVRKMERLLASQVSNRTIKWHLHPNKLFGMVSQGKVVEHETFDSGPVTSTGLKLGLRTGSLQNRSQGGKASSHHCTATSMFNCWHDVLILECCVSFISDIMRPVSSTLDSSVHRTFSQKAWGSSRCYFSNARCTLMFLLVSSGFCLAHSPMNIIFALSLS